MRITKHQLWHVMTQRPNEPANPQEAAKAFKDHNKCSCCGEVDPTVKWQWEQAAEAVNAFFNPKPPEKGTIEECSYCALPVRWDGERWEHHENPEIKHEGNPNPKRFEDDCPHCDGCGCGECYIPVNLDEQK